MRKAFLYRLYLNKAQSTSIQGFLDISRTFYNSALQERRDAWKHKVSLNYYDQANQLKEIRSENPSYALLNYSATQDTLRRLDNTFKAFYRRVQNGEKAGYPRFKSRDQFDSITFPKYGDGINLRDGRLYIQNIGTVKIKIHRPLVGEIKTVTIKKQCDKWYAIFSTIIDIEPLFVSNKKVGIDVGLESFATTSDGEVIENPRFLRESEAVLRKAQRKVSHRKKRGSNRRKSVKLLARHHMKVKNQRKDFAHKLSRRIVDTYGFIAVEDLRIKDMVRNHHLARSISDVAWGMFLSFTAYKAEYAGRQFIRVNPKGTSQICSICGAIVPKTLATRIHDCPECNHCMSRDLNSSFNILALGLSVWDLTWSNGSCVSQEAVI